MDGHPGQTRLYNPAVLCTAAGAARCIDGVGIGIGLVQVKGRGAAGAGQSGAAAQQGSAAVKN